MMNTWKKSRGLLTAAICLLCLAALLCSCMNGGNNASGTSGNGNAPVKPGKPSGTVTPDHGKPSGTVSPTSGVSGSEDGTLLPVTGGKEIPMMLYSEETPFEHWTSGEGRHYYQLCVVWNVEALDATEKLGGEDYPFRYRVYYRPAGSSGNWKSAMAPVETVYRFDDGNVIYRLQTEAMMADLEKGGAYETVVEILRGEETLGYGCLTLRYTEASAKAFEEYRQAMDNLISGVSER